MADLAIKGHSTRSKEVIELLEMLGGKNIYKLDGKKDLWYILSNSTIEHATYCFDERSFILEEFLEKYPYKVGDQVIAYAEGILASFSIKGMRWNNKLNKVEYKICSAWYDASVLSAIQPYTDYDIKTNKEEDKDMSEHTSEINLNHPCFDGHNKIELIIPENWKFEQIDNKMFGIRKYPQYPKTYGECCDILGYDASEDELNCNKGGLIESFVRLLICRNAYWKIAGEQMGLDKPWEPDWGENDGGYRYCIRNRSNKIVLSNEWLGENYILSFPTAEMQDEFYKNFKDLINKVKELL